MAEAPASTAAEPLHQTLASARKELLDLSSRNRLVHTPRDNSRSSRLDIVGERADDVFRILVREGRAMTFAGREGDGGEPTEPEDAEERYTDNKLETQLEGEALSKRLLRCITMRTPSWRSRASTFCIWRSDFCAGTKRPIRRSPARLR